MSLDDEAASIPEGNASSTLGPMTPVMIDHLRATKPWARLVSVVGFVMSGFILLVAIAMPFVGAVSREFGGAIGGAAMGLAYLVFGCLYLFPSLFLFRYASAIRKLLIARDSESMEQALFHQRSFWRLVGIATLVLLCIYAVMIAVVALVAAGAALR